MHSKSIGDIGEAKVLAKFLELGYDVYLPFGENTRIDMIVDINGELYKIQVKTCSKIDNGCSKFHLSNGCYRAGHDKAYLYAYNNTQIDYFALYSMEAEEIYFIHVDDANSSGIWIRNNKPNKEHTSIRNAEDYLIDNVIENLP